MPRPSQSWNGREAAARESAIELMISARRCGRSARRGGDKARHRVVMMRHDCGALPSFDQRRTDDVVTPEGLLSSRPPNCSCCRRGAATRGVRVVRVPRLVGVRPFRSGYGLPRRISGIVAPCTPRAFSPRARTPRVFVPRSAGRLEVAQSIVDGCSSRRLVAPIPMACQWSPATATDGRKPCLTPPTKTTTRSP